VLFYHNFVTKSEGIPEGVLIRAIEPEDGLSAMFRNRGKKGYEVTNGFNVAPSIARGMLNALVHFPGPFVTS
jgi:3-methyladenine DNA glycosylase Mpg